MILGFKKEFPWGAPTNFQNKILQGIKIHTIREGNRWQPGIKIHFSTGVRTKNYECFALGKVSKVLQIEVNPKHKRVLIEKPARRSVILCRLSAFEMEHLAIDDGFDSLDDFWNWFHRPLLGQIIYWEVEYGL